MTTKESKQTGICQKFLSYSGRQKACSDFLQNNINDKNETAVLVLNCIIQDDFVGGYIVLF